MPFKDHFSGHASSYAESRPTYPDDLFVYLHSLAREHDLAWDCATGNGQAAVSLAKHFKQVVASDASEEQLSQATKANNVRYVHAQAESCFLEAGSVDLIVVAQAFHWFDSAAFFRNAKLVLKQRGILAIWCYGLHRISPEIDAVTWRLYSEILGNYWPLERVDVEKGYKGINFPLTELKPPGFDMSLDWTLDSLKDYLMSWSALRRYMEQHGENPLDLVEQDYADAWSGSTTRKVSWPLSMRIGLLA